MAGQFIHPTISDRGSGDAGLRLGEDLLLDEVVLRLLHSLVGQDTAKSGVTYRSLSAIVQGK